MITKCCQCDLYWIF